MFDFNKFSEHEECVICLMPFEDSDMVTPLPCDKRHYFHSACIEQWSKTNNDCPLCKTVFDTQLLEQAQAARTSITQQNAPEYLNSNGLNMSEGNGNQHSDSASEQLL